MIHGCGRGMLAGLCLFWLSASGWAVAQPTSVVQPVPAGSPSHRLLEKVQHDIALVEPWLDRYGYGHPITHKSNSLLRCNFSSSGGHRA